MLANKKEPKFYLEKYIGKYRVVADFDLSTQDFIRDEFGQLDKSFDGYYIKCSNDIKIRHGFDNVLSCYIPSLGRGNNILKKIYCDKYKAKEENLPSLRAICKKLVDDEVLLDVDVLDCEVYFIFEESILGYIAEIVGARSNGSDIQPIDIRNLPKETYGIPECRLEEFAKVSKEIDMPIAKYKKMYIDFIESKTNNRNNLMQKFQALEIPPKNFIYKCGLWKELLQFMVSYSKQL